MLHLNPLIKNFQCYESVDKVRIIVILSVAKNPFLSEFTTDLWILHFVQNDNNHNSGHCHSEHSEESILS